MATDWEQFSRRLHVILKQVKARTVYGSVAGSPGTRLVDDPAIVLRTLIRSLPEPDRPIVPAFLWREITQESAPAIAIVLLDVHLISSWPGAPDHDVLGFLLIGANEFVNHESDRVGESDISDLRTLISIAENRIGKSISLSSNDVAPLTRGSRTLSHTLDLLEYARVRKEIREGENPEINTDRAELISVYRELGFTEELERALLHAESKFLAADDAFDFKAVMGSVRGCLEEIATAAIQKYGNAVGVDPKLPDRAGKFGACRSSMVRNGLLSKIEGDAVQAFYDFLSVEGAHVLSSQRTQARLSKNMMIEWGLLILSRVRAAAPS